MSDEESRQQRERIEEREEEQGAEHAPLEQDPRKAAQQAGQTGREEQTNQP